MPFRAFPIQWRIPTLISPLGQCLSALMMVLPSIGLLSPPLLNVRIFRPFSFTPFHWTCSPARSVGLSVNDPLRENFGTSFWDAHSTLSIRKGLGCNFDERRPTHGLLLCTSFPSPLYSTFSIFGNSGICVCSTDGAPPRLIE